MKRVAAAVMAVFLAGMAGAQERGAETNLPIPRFVSLKAAEANLRRGPGLTHKIDWVLKRRDMPLMVIGEYGHWRRVSDRDGASGWVHYSLISGVRTVLVTRDLVGLHMRPDAETMVKAFVEAGVVAELDECQPDWCRVDADGYSGWVAKADIWGVFPDEVFD